MEFAPRPGGGYKLTSYSATARASDLVARSVLASHVQKRGGRTSGEWNPRFVVLRPSVSLLYFDSESDPVERAKGVLVLDDSAVIDIGASDSEGGGPVVVVRPSPSDPEARSLFFRVGSTSEAQEWQQALQACRVSTAHSQCTDLERRLEVSRAETGALHSSLTAYKGALQEQEDEKERLNEEIERQKEILTEQLAREQQLRALQVERERQHGEALAGGVEALARVARVLAAENARAREFLASCSIGTVQLGAAHSSGSGSGSAAGAGEEAPLPGASRRRAFTEGGSKGSSSGALERAPSLPPSLAAARAGVAVVQAGASSSSEGSGSGSGSSEFSEATCALDSASPALAALAEREPHFLAYLVHLRDLGTVVDGAASLFSRSRGAYKALRARALEVGRIVGRLERVQRGAREAETVREESWLAKERQWAAVVQALSVRLAREKERVTSLMEMLKTKSAALASVAAATTAAAAAAAGPAAASPSPSSSALLDSTPGSVHPRSRTSSLTASLGPMGSVAAAAAAAATSGAGAVEEASLATSSFPLASTAGEGHLEPGTPHLVAATASFAAGFITPKKLLSSSGLEELEEHHAYHRKDGSSGSGSGSSLPSSARVLPGEGGDASAGEHQQQHHEGRSGGGGRRESDLEHAFGALQSAYEVPAGGAAGGGGRGAEGSSSGRHAGRVKGGEDHGGGEEEHKHEQEEDLNPFGGDGESDNPFSLGGPTPVKLVRAPPPAAAAAASALQPATLPLNSTPKPPSAPFPALPNQQQQRTPLLNQPAPATSRGSPSMLSRQKNPPPEASISIAHLSGGAAEHSAIRRAAERAAGLMGGLLGRKSAQSATPSSSSSLSSSLSSLPSSSAAGAAAAAAAGGGGAGATAISGSSAAVLADPCQGRLYVMVVGVQRLPEYSIKKAAILPGLQVKATASFAEQGSPTTTAPPAFDLSTERSSPVMRIDEIGRTRNLLSEVNCVYSFRASSIASGSLRLEVHTVGTMFQGHKVGTAIVDVSGLAEDPGQPYALWANVVTAEAEAAQGEPLRAHPSHREMPVRASFQWAGASAAIAAADATKHLPGVIPSAMVDAASLQPVPPALTAAEAKRHGKALVPFAAIAPPEDPTQACILIQLCFCLRPDDKPAFAQLQQRGEQQLQQQQQLQQLQLQQLQQQQKQLNLQKAALKGGRVVGAPPPPGLPPTLHYPPTLGGLDDPSAPLGGPANAKLSKQVAILRKAFKGLVLEKQTHEDSALEWAAEREALRAHIQKLQRALGGASSSPERGAAAPLLLGDAGGGGALGSNSSSSGRSVVPTFANSGGGGGGMVEEGKGEGKDACAGEAVAVGAVAALPSLAAIHPALPPLLSEHQVSSSSPEAEVAAATPAVPVPTEAPQVPAPQPAPAALAVPTEAPQVPAPPPVPAALAAPMPAPLPAALSDPLHSALLPPSLNISHEELDL